MLTIYRHEVESYRAAIRSASKNVREGSEQDNLTHAALAHSNQLNLMLVGLCGLAEARMFELASRCNESFHVKDIRGQGISQLKLFLNRTDVVDFSTLRNWSQFSQLYKIRNAIVHSYGGLVLEEVTEKVNRAVSELNLHDSLVADRRIRMTTSALSLATDIIEGLLDELGAFEA